MEKKTFTSLEENLRNFNHYTWSDWKHYARPLKQLSYLYFLDECEKRLALYEIKRVLLEFGILVQKNGHLCNNESLTWAEIEELLTSIEAALLTKGSNSLAIQPYVRIYHLVLRFKQEHLPVQREA